MSELVFEVTQEADGGYCAECLTAGIFTEGDTWDAIRENVQEAVKAYYFDSSTPGSIRLSRPEKQHAKSTKRIN
jgi:predicted RNase H-like HicB family nuclease